MSSVFLETVIAFLMPHFIAAAPDPVDARNEILDTLAEYAPRTRSELLHAAHIIAFGMTTLETLAEAKTAALSASMRLKARSCANGLARALHQSEKALARSLAREALAATEPAPLTSTPAPANKDRPALGAGLLPQTQQDRDQRIWASAMIATLQQLGIPPQPTPAA